MRVTVVDPGSILPFYTHGLATALAADGHQVELVTSPFKFSTPPVPDGYTRVRPFYPLSARLFRRSRAQLPIKAVEHPLGLLALRRRAGDVVHVQWAPVPEVDRWLLPWRRPTVITAHDILPSRTAAKVDLWRHLYARFDRIVVHSEHGRRRLATEVDVDPARVDVIPHPVFARTPRYADDGATLLIFGVIRPYKQVEHAVALARRLGVRLIVVGDPTYDLGALTSQPGVEWRLGFATEEELDEALSEATLAVFPYREELDQSGALMRAIGAGVPAVVYDVGGMGETVEAYGAGAVAPADDQDALLEVTRDLLGDPAALQRARLGAQRCSAERSWEHAARRHVEAYEAATAAHSGG